MVWSIKKFSDVKRCHNYVGLISTGLLVGSFFFMYGSLRSMFNEVHFHFRTSSHSYLRNHRPNKSATNRTILFWTTFSGMTDPYALEGSRLFADCPYSNCVPSLDRGDASKADAVMFYVSDYKFDFPLNLRDPKQYFMFYYAESPASAELVPNLHEWHRLRSFFNLTLTHRLDSDIFLRMYFDYYKPHDYQRRNRTKNILWLVSHCPTHSRREDYTKELAKYIDVDVFGRCGKPNPERAAELGGTMNLTREYRFYLSFENTLCKDYVTEKLMFALNNDLVPIVYGGANYSSFLPKGSFINVEDYSSPKTLADLLRKLAQNEEEYEKYHAWKRKDWDFPAIPTRTESSWCKLCQTVNEKTVEKVYDDITAWWFHGQSRSPNMTLFV